jgi:hypothetical protein
MKFPAASDRVSILLFMEHAEAKRPSLLTRVRNRPKRLEIIPFRFINKPKNISDMFLNKNAS